MRCQGAGGSAMARGFAGVDEVGRGPLAGPVVAAAVILPDPCAIAGLADSKLLDARRREFLAGILREQAAAWALGSASAAEIDRMNIHYATLLAMRRAVDALPGVPGELLVDGRFTPDGPWRATAVVGGDGTIPAISAASILAKVARDALLVELHDRYPVYGFDRHVGYATPAHLRALERYGPCPEHRRSFAPVARRLGIQGVLEPWR